MENENKKAIEELFKSFSFFIQEALKSVTSNYDGVIVSEGINGKWNVRFNGETHAISHYGDFEPKIGKMVKVFIPNGNMSIAYFI